MPSRGGVGSRSRSRGREHTQTNASYPAMEISCMPSRGGVGSRSRSRGRALYRDASQAAKVLCPPSTRGGDLELEGRVNVYL